MRKDAIAGGYTQVKRWQYNPIPHELLGGSIR
jgi:hypothetical protein